MLLGVNMAASAAENLYFDQDIPRSSLEKIKTYSINALEQDIQNFEIGKADLNNDGLDEFIARTKNCNIDGKCQFHVLAEADGYIQSLGILAGQNLLLGNEYRHGIRNLLVFKDASNDFDYELYTWHPETSEYRKSAP